MAEQQRPVVVAFDGSAESQLAVATAAELFRDRQIIVVSVWETGLAMASPAPASDFTGAPLTLPDPEEVRILDRIEHDHAQSTAEAGAKLVEAAGGRAVPVPVPDELDIADAVESVAEERQAAVIVVGSRGRGALRSKLMGSTSQRLLHHARFPVLVVRAREER